VLLLFGSSDLPLPDANFHPVLIFLFGSPSGSLILFQHVFVPLENALNFFFVDASNALLNCIHIIPR
jgi:hypothetical protein